MIIDDNQEGSGTTPAFAIGANTLFAPYNCQSSASWDLNPYAAVTLPYSMYITLVLLIPSGNPYEIPNQNNVYVYVNDPI